MDVSLRVIRGIQCLTAILAFSTTVAYAIDFAFSITCLGSVMNFEYKIGYPFSHIVLGIPLNCDSTNSGEMILQFSYSIAAQFFVATGVLSLLYAIGIMVVYIFFHQSYNENTKLPILDLGISAVLSVFWLAGSSAWARGVTLLKNYFNPEIWFNSFAICSNGTCKSNEGGSYGLLNFSLVLGFANVLLWTSSVWFVYKGVKRV